MKTAALIGYPLAHSITPLMYAPAFAAMGIEARCEKWVTPPEELRACVERLRQPGMFGANVTVPHKEAVLPLLDQADASARTIGAVNCIVRGATGTLTGYNTDKDGFLRSLREAGFEPRGHCALILGAGGAARAVAAGLIEAGIEKLIVANRTRARAEALISDVQAGDAKMRVAGWHEPAFESACDSADLIVNTTPIGTARTEIAGDSPLETRHFRPGLMAYDLVYNPPLTPFLRRAVDAGATPVSGLEMLIYQGAESIRLWTGREPPVDVMRQAARGALES